MNILRFIVLFFASASLHGCPTCTGRITQSSPPFFSDEFYKQTAENMDELYQKVVVLSQETPPALNSSTKESQ